MAGADGDGEQGDEAWRTVADWASRAVFLASLVVGWIGVGPPWDPKVKGGAGILESGLVLVGAFVIAALVQRVIVADYAIKAGPIELASLERAAIKTTDVGETVTEELRDALTKVAADIAELKTARDFMAAQLVALNLATEYLEAFDEETLKAVETLNEEVTRGGRG